MTIADMVRIYLLQSRGYNYKAISSTPRHKKMTEWYKDQLVDCVHTTPGCVDERVHINASSLVNIGNISDQINKSEEGKISLRPCIVGGSSFFLTALGLLSGYSYDTAFRKAVEICERINWKMKAHIDNQTGDNGCGFGHNLYVILANSIKMLNAHTKSVLPPLNGSIPPSQEMLFRLRQMPEQTRIITMAIGKHKANKANILFITDKNKTIVRDDLYKENPTFSVNLSAICSPEIYQVLKSIFGQTFAKTYDEFVKWCIEIHLSTFEVLGVYAKDRKNIFIV